MTVVLIEDASGGVSENVVNNRLVVDMGFSVGNDPANNSYTYLMRGWSPDLSAFVQWISEGSPNYFPTATLPACNVNNLINKTIYLQSLSATPQQTQVPSLLDTATSIWNFEQNALDDKYLHHGIATDLTYTNSGGPLGYYANFNGSTSKVDLNISSNMPEFTYMAKIEIASFPVSPHTQYTLLSKNSLNAISQTDFPFSCVIGPSGGSSILIDGGGDFSADTIISSASNLSLNLVQTIVISVKEGGTGKICINGGAIASAAITTMSDNFQSWHLGMPAQLNGVAGNTVGLDGKIFQLVFWDRQLTDAEIQSL